MNKNILKFKKIHIIIKIMNNLTIKGQFDVNVWQCIQM